MVVSSEISYGNARQDFISRNNRLLSRHLNYDDTELLHFLYQAKLILKLSDYQRYLDHYGIDDPLDKFEYFPCSVLVTNIYKPVYVARLRVIYISQHCDSKYLTKNFDNLIEASAWLDESIAMFERNSFQLTIELKREIVKIDP